MFLPLIEKIRGKISHWANQFLSYAGKVQLIQAVIFGLSNFWGASVLLPKTVVKKVEKLCKDFFWGINDGSLRMVFKSWASFCLPRKEGGVDIKEVLSWNKAQMLKWVWKFHACPNSVWVKWVNAYILKGQSVWTATSKLDQSCCWKGILKAKDELIQATGSVFAAQALLQPDVHNGKFSAGTVYEIFRPRLPTVSWSRAVWDCAAIPKTAIIGCLAAQNRLATIDNLCTRGFQLANRCILCKSASESVSHLFFTCSYSSSVWFSILAWLGIHRSPMSLPRELHWMKQHNKGKTWRKRRVRCALVCSIYEIWRERNSRIFRSEESSPQCLARKIMYLVCVRIFHCSNSEDDEFFV